MLKYFFMPGKIYSEIHLPIHPPPPPPLSVVTLCVSVCMAEPEAKWCVGGGDE